MKRSTQGGSRPMTGRKSRTGPTLTFGGPSALLDSHQPNHPPSLKDRPHGESEMFQYYAVRGNMELIRDDGAVKCCLGEGGAVVESEVVVEVLPTYSEPRRGGSTQSKQGGPNFRLLGTHGSVVQPERDLVAPPRVTASAPLFPRLRPTHEEDKHSVFHQLSEEAEQREARQKRRSNVNLPSVQTYYGGMYWQPSPITDGLKVSLEEQARQHAKAAAQALEERIITPASTGNAAAPVATSMKRLSLSTSQTRRPSAQSRISPKSSLGVRPPLPESPQLDISHTESMMLSTAKLPQSDTTVTALGKHEGHIAAAQEMEDIFVAAHFIQHPELAEKREQSERLRRASQAASAPKKRKKKKARRGPKPPPEGAPAENLRFFRTSLLTCCDAQGQISRSQLERVLADLPFEVTNMVAVHEFFDDIRVMTEAKQDEAQPIADAASNSMGTNPQDPDTSRRSVGNLPSGTMGTVSNQTSTSKLFSASSRPRLAMGSSVRSLEKHTNSSQQQLPLAPLDAASPVKGIVAQLEDPVVYLREILAALDAIINGPDTRMVIRWVCFQTLAAEGKGYIHKATVQLIRKQLREECEKPDCPLSASSIKVLSDCFDRIAQEEEEEYIKVLNKGKRKKKAPVLQSHQKSAIPLNVMRKCHMDFKTFCRLFDLLPQVPAAFTRVWMGLLFTGHVGPTPATPPSARNAVVIQSPVESPLGLNRSRSETSTGAPAHNNGLSSYSPTSPANTHTGFTIGGSQHASTAAHDDPSIMADEGSRASKRTMMLDYEEMGDEEFHMAEVEPNTYPLLKLGRLGPRQEILRRLIHARLEVMRQGKDAILRQQQQEEEQRRQEELEREEMNAKRE